MARYQVYYKKKYMQIEKCDIEFDSLEEAREYVAKLMKDWKHYKPIAFTIVTNK